MKKIIALIVFAIFALPTFAFTVKVVSIKNNIAELETTSVGDDVNDAKFSAFFSPFSL